MKLFNEEILSSLLQEAEDKNAQLVIVTKTRDVKTLQSLYDSGYKTFGENRVQEMVLKRQELPEDIEWHMIGHLQRNKVKEIIPFVSMIHSVDSLRLLKEINRQASKLNRLIPCLLQVHIAQEHSKFGLQEKELMELLENCDLLETTNVQICGVMGMATFTNDKEQVKGEFEYLVNLFQRVKSKFFLEDTGFREISMGMSGDYQLALKCGSTIVRIGSLIFR